MKNWPPHRHTRIQRLRIRFTAALLRAAKKWKPRDWLVLRSLKGDANHHLRIRELERTSAPPGWNFRLLQLSFADLYFSEELDQVRRGFLRLRRDCSAPHPFRDMQTREIRKWFDETRQRSAGGGAQHNAGSLDFTKLPRDLRPSTIRSAGVWLTQLSPSIISITFVANPTPLLAAAFNNLATTDRTDEADILGFSLRRGITRMEGTAATRARQAEYDELILGTDAELTRILRRYLGVGLAMVGPLPGTEIIVFDKRLSDLPGKSSRENGDDHWHLGTFLRALGRAGHIWNVFGTTWCEAYPVARSEHYHVPTWQMLASMGDFLAQHTSRVTGGSDDDELLHSLWFKHMGLGPILAVAEFYQFLSRSVLATRDELAPIIGAESKIRRRFRIQQAHQNISRANWLAFRQSRLWQEVTHSAFPMWLTNEINDLVRPADPQLGTEQVTMSAAIWDDIKYVHRFCSRQLTLMRYTFRQLLDYQNIAASYRLQGKVRWLAVVAAVAAVIALVPERARTRLWEFLINWIGC